MINNLGNRFAQISEISICSLSTKRLLIFIVFCAVKSNIDSVRRKNATQVDVIVVTNGRMFPRDGVKG